MLQKRDKKGSSPLYYLFELMAAVLITIVLVNIARSAASGEDVQRTFLVQYSALIIDALQAAPGNARIDYSTGVFNNSHDLDIDADKVAVSNPQVPIERASWLYVGDKRFNILPTKHKIQPGMQNTFQFAKIGNELKVAPIVEFDPQRLTCQLAGINKTDVAKTFLDVDPESMSILSAFAVSNYGSKSEGSQQERIEAINSFDPKMIFTIRKTDGSPRIDVPLKSTVPGKNQRMACLLYNELYAEDSEIDLAIGPSADGLLNSFNDKPIIMIAGNIDALKLSNAMARAVSKLAED